jgi:esterase/lipase superfamily enzyme
MILISCRKDFTSDRAFAGANQYRNYQTFTQVQDITERNVLKQAEGKHVLVLVHGYRSPIKNLYSSYNRLLQGLTDSGLMAGQNYGLVLGYCWPGFKARVSFFLAVPYANRGAGFFRTFLDKLGETAKTVDVQTHSLGARVALQALSAGAKPKKIDNVLLTAPAVDNEALEPDKEFHAALGNAKRCFVYHSANDPVLAVSYRIGKLDKALGYQGPENPQVVLDQCKNVYTVDCSGPVHDHGGYRGAGVYYEHWSRVLAGTPLPRQEVLVG